MLRNSPFFQLYRARLREFYRQPARIFWVYGFPTVLAVVLGFAFQSRPPAPIQVDLVEGPFSAPIEEAIRNHNDRLAAAKASPGDLKSVILPPVSLEVAPQDQGRRAAEHGQDRPGDRADRRDVVVLPLRPDPTRGRRRSAGDRRYPSGGRRPGQPVASPVTFRSPSPDHATSTS